jgi:asparagine synthase (glutamine-hydrolysing)
MRVLLKASPAAWDRMFGVAKAFVPNLRTPGTKVHKLARVIRAESPDDLHAQLATMWEFPARLVRDGAESRDSDSLPDLSDDAATMMLRDLVTYLPDDILTKVDRASMAVALEARVPLLDHRVVEFAWTLPQSMKVRGRTGKWILREVLARHVPRPLFERPKMGFGVPIGEWLRGPLRGWAADLLDPGAMRRAGYLVPEPIGEAWEAHLSGRVDHSAALWTVLMFQAWLAAEASPPRTVSS